MFSHPRGRKYTCGDHCLLVFNGLLVFLGGGGLKCSFCWQEWGAAVAQHIGGLDLEAEGSQFEGKTWKVFCMLTLIFDYIKAKSRAEYCFPLRSVGLKAAGV